MVGGSLLYSTALVVVLGQGQHSPLSSSPLHFGFRTRNVLALHFLDDCHTVSFCSLLLDLGLVFLGSLELFGESWSTHFVSETGSLCGEDSHGLGILLPQSSVC